MQVTWTKCSGEVWCKLNAVRLEHAHFDNRVGVYVIWHGGGSAATVRVGQGDIRDCITQARADTEIQAFAALGLFVTWATVAPEHRNGVEAFLSGRLRPKVIRPLQNAIPIEVNLPW
jgi:hypothetical protein